MPIDNTSMEKALREARTVLALNDFINSGANPGAPILEFDKEWGELAVNDHAIYLTGNQKSLCGLFFRASKPIAKSIEVGDILWKLEKGSRGRKYFLNTRQNLNDTIYKRAGLSDFIGLEQNKAFINKSYLKKS